MQFSVYNTAGEVVDSVELNDSVFAVPVNRALLHQAVLRQRANARVGTASTKTRGMVAGTGAKLFRQKGTGRARQGSRKAPHWIGGGVVFGPHPRSYEQAMPRQMRRQAVKSALSARVSEDHFVVVDSLRFDEPKTKAMLAVLENLRVAPRSALVVLPEPNSNVVKSARNIPGVKTLPADSLNVLDILSHDYLIMPVEAARKVEQALS
ncbi:MAG: 50S ribosomal protein L4 [Chloroflexota bacterium]